MVNVQGWYELRWKVFARDKFTCQYCGRPAPEVVLHLDHKVPVSAGGEFSEENLLTCCSACNIGKSDYVYVNDEFVRARSVEEMFYLNIEGARRVKNRPPTIRTNLAHLLAGEGPMPVTRLAERMGKSRPLVSKVLLSNPSLFVPQKIGRERVYSYIGVDPKLLRNDLRGTKRMEA